MRLLTHNAMRNNSKDANGKGYPLSIEVEQVQVLDSHVVVTDREIVFIQRLLTSGTIDWSVLVQAASQVGLAASLPPTLPDERTTADPQFLKALYHIVMNVHVITGSLVCPETGKRFQIKEGIPNMILEEEECEKVRF